MQMLLIYSELLDDQKVLAMSTELVRQSEKGLLLPNFLEWHRAESNASSPARQEEQAHYREN